MFVTTTLPILNMVLNVFQVVLIFSLGRILMIYAKFGGEYANSMRWIHQGGFLDMWRASIRGYKAPKKIKATMFFVLVVTTLAGFSTTILSHIIQPSQEFGKSSFIMTVTTPYIPNTGIANLATWIRYVPRGSSVSDAILSMVNASQSTPSSNSKTIYQVHRSEYDITCDAMDVSFNDTLLNDSPGSCMSMDVNVVSLSAAGNWGTSVVARADGTASVTTHSQTLTHYVELSPILLLTYRNVSCGLADISGTLLAYFINGISSPPTTVVTKCWTFKGEMVVISMTTTRFHAAVLSLNTTITSLFGNNQLLSAVETSIRTTTFTTNSSQSIEFLETKVGGTSADMAACMTAIEFEDTAVIAICSYTSIHVIVAQSTVFNSITTAKLGSRLNRNISGIVTTIKHLPTTLKTNASLLILDTMGITYEVADLFALFGGSFIVDWNNAQLYMIFLKTEIVAGFEVPLWLILAACTIVVICLVLRRWTLTFEKVYTSSFYDVVASQLVFGLGKAETRLMPSEFRGKLRLGEGRIIYEKQVSLS